MNTYEIETAHGTITVQGDNFFHDGDNSTGDITGYQVTKDGDLVAFIQAHAFVSVVVK